MFMFIYQLQEAIGNLIDPPVVEVTEHLKIATVELPMITVCPTKQFNDSIWIQFGYGSYKEFLRGVAINSDTKLRANKTFWDIVDEALVYSPGTDMDLNLEKTKGNWTKVFYPKYGFCWNLANYTYSDEIKIISHNLIEKAGNLVVYLTDKHLNTVFDINIASQRGPLMLIEKGMKNTYYVEIEKLSYLEPKNITCKNYETMEYAKCVDKEIQNVTKAAMYACNPPWLSTTNSCTTMDWLDKMNTSLGFMEMQKEIKARHAAGIQFLFLARQLQEMENVKAKRACPLPCTVIQSEIRPGSSEVSTGSTIRLLFDDIVSYSHNVINYK